MSLSRAKLTSFCKSRRAGGPRSRYKRSWIKKMRRWGKMKLEDAPTKFQACRTDEWNWS